MAERPAARGRPPRWAFLLGAAGIGVAVGLTAALLHSSHAPAAPDRTPLQAQVTWDAGTRPAPGFALRDQRGADVSLDALRGRPVLVTFLDSRCTRECPLEGRVLHDVLDRLRGTKAAALVVSVDPWGDTRASARRFAARAGWSGDWHWLLGDRAVLAPVWRAYHVAVRRTPGDVVHSAALYVVDPTGHLRSAYLFPFSAEAVAASVRRLAPST